MPVKCAVCGKMHETLDEMRERAMMRLDTPAPEPIPRKLWLKKKTSEDAF